MNESLPTYLNFAIQTAQAAGQITLKYFQKDILPEWKPDASPVTIADKETEHYIRSCIEKAFPDHAILGEEFGATSERGIPYRWIIDPIDGTRSFIHGVPLYGILIGLEIDGLSQVGVAHFPAMQETLYAAKGLGCWWNGHSARVSGLTRLDQALVTHTDPAVFAKRGKGQAWSKLQQAVQYCAGWGDCYGYLLVATGRAEVMLDPIMSVWDCGPFPVIFGEAGGYFGDWQGNITMYGGEAMATNQALLPEVLNILKGAENP